MLVDAGPRCLVLVGASTDHVKRSWLNSRVDDALEHSDLGAQFRRVIMTAEFVVLGRSHTTLVDHALHDRADVVVGEHATSDFPATQPVYAARDHAGFHRRRRRLVDRFALSTAASAERNARIDARSRSFMATVNAARIVDRNE